MEDELSVAPTAEDDDEEEEEKEVEVEVEVEVDEAVGSAPPRAVGWVSKASGTPPGSALAAVVVYGCNFMFAKDERSSMDDVTCFSSLISAGF